MSRNNVSVAEHALTSASYEAGAKVAAEPIPGSTRSIMFPTLNDLFKLPAFYAEFAPLARHEGYVECIYLLKDCGVMTADCRSFSSPCSDIAFVFPQVDGVSRAPKIVADRPTFGHKERRRPFSGRIFDIKGGPSLPLNPDVAGPSVERCRDWLAQAAVEAPRPRFLECLDNLLDNLTTGAPIAPDLPDAAGENSVTELAGRLGKSARTLQRHSKRSTGLAPKRLLATNRFSRAVYDLTTQTTAPSAVAGDLGFADQAHLTREFRRHAGLSPAAFQRTWRGMHGQAVRFVQDAGSPDRLIVAAWASDRHG